MATKLHETILVICSTFRAADEVFQGLSKPLTSNKPPLVKLADREL